MNAKNTFTGPAGNKVSEYDGFTVSFCNFKHPLGESFSPETRHGETALIVDGRYYILNGDWKLTYDELAPQGLQACIEFFKAKQPLFGSIWSENVEDR